MTDPTSEPRSQLTATLEMYLGDLLAEHERLVEEDREKAASVADLVHDLRGSITSLSLRIYMLEHSEADKQPYYLAELKESVGDLTKMAEELLNRMRHQPDDESIHYLTPVEIYALAEEALGREPDVRDRHLLRSAAARPALQAFGEEAYPTLLDKAAALMHSMAAHHLFFDGNKRSATRVTTEFLARNGLRPTWNADQVYDFVLEIAQNKHEVPAIAAWLSDHTQPMPE